MKQVKIHPLMSVYPESPPEKALVRNQSRESITSSSPSSSSSSSSPSSPSPSSTTSPASKIKSGTSSLLHRSYSDENVAQCDTPTCEPHADLHIRGDSAVSEEFASNRRKTSNECHITCPNDDLSYSMVVDNNRRRQLSHCRPEKPIVEAKSIAAAPLTSNLHVRQRATWVSDDLIVKCAECQTSFGLYTRRHHCRVCGHIFCYHCTRFRMSVPVHLEQLPTNPQTLITHLLSQILWDQGQVRVCGACAAFLAQIKRLESLLNVFNHIPLALEDYRRISCVSQMWRQMGLHYLSRFRELQYRLPQTHNTFTAFEQQLLWVNRHNLAGHSQYLTALCRSIDYHNYGQRRDYLPGITQVLPMPRKKSCWQMMCTRICGEHHSSLEALVLLDDRITAQEIRRYAIECLETATDMELLCYLPYLTTQMIHESLEQALIGPFLIRRAKESTTLAHELYWDLKIGTEDRANYRIYHYFIEQLQRTLDPITVQGFKATERLVTFLQTLPKTAGESQIRDLLARNQKLFKGVKLPTHAKLICQEIILERVRLKDSASRPLLLPLRCLHPDTGKSMDYCVLYKFEDVRADRVTTKAIQLMDLLLQRDLKRSNCLPIITYNVVPTTVRSGLIEIIPDCQTVYYIKEHLHFTLLNYMIEHNPRTTIDELRHRFLESCAAYCVITYLLGVGDRHLENIMLTRDGYLFHIDYGFIIGSDPKPMNHPQMRITTDMVDALGGVHSKYHGEFITLSQEIHQCLRRHIAPLFKFLTLLTTMQPPVYIGHSQTVLTPDRLTSEVVQRFMHGENYEQAQLQLCTQIDNGTRSYHHTITDFLHYHSREQTVMKALSAAYGAVRGLFR